MTASQFGPGHGPNMTLQPALQRFSVPSSVAGPIFAAVEFLVLTLSPLAGSVLYHAAISVDYDPPMPPLLMVGAIMAALYLALSQTRGVFEIDELRALSLRKPLLRWCLALMFFGVIAFAFKIGDTFSRGAMTTGFLIGATAIVGLRLAAAFTVNMAFRHKVLEGRRALLLSDGPLPPTLPMQELIQSGVSVHGWFQMPFTNQGDADGSFQRECDDVRRFARDRGVEDIIVVADPFRESPLARMLDELRILPLRVLLVPRHALGSAIRPPHPRDALGMALTVQTPPFSNAERRAKRILDVVLASILLVGLSPLLLVIGIAIRMDSRGPVLFRQTRQGFCGRPFMIFKFRSMTTTDNGNVIKQAQRGDSRITRVGRFLRETSLDELPQLINVVLGDMSLIGPRPHAVAHDRLYEPQIPAYAWRYHALPGMTGWAQVNGHRGETRDLASMEARVEHDLWYIRNWSIWLDLKILLMTFRAVLKSTNAY